MLMEWRSHLVWLGFLPLLSENRVRIRRSCLTLRFGDSPGHYWLFKLEDGWAKGTNASVACRFCLQLCLIQLFDNQPQQ